MQTASLYLPHAREVERSTSQALQFGKGSKSCLSCLLADMFDQGEGDWSSVRRKTDRIRILQRDKKPQPSSSHVPQGKNCSTLWSHIEEKDNRNYMIAADVEDLVGPPIIKRSLGTPFHSHQQYHMQRNPECEDGSPLLDSVNRNPSEGSIGRISPLYMYHDSPHLPLTSSSGYSLSSSMQKDPLDWPGVGSEGAMATQQVTTAAWSGAVKKPVHVKKNLKVCMRVYCSSSALVVDIW